MVRHARKQSAKITRIQGADAHQHVVLFDRLGNISSNLSDNKWVMRIFLASFIVFAVLYISFWTGDTDIWWHFALGKYYITHHVMNVNHAIFSWTPANPDWLYNTWLGSAIVYLVYNAAEGFGLWLFQWGIFACIFLFLLFFVRSVQGKLNVNAIALIFMIFIALGLELLLPKPELFTPLFFTALLFVFFSIKRDGISPQYFYLYPPMFVFWVNLHGGFVVGLGVMALLLLAEYLHFLFARQSAFPPRTLFHFSCSLILSCLACLLNPYGLAYPWDTMTVNYPIFSQMTGERGLYLSAIKVHLPIWSYLLRPRYFRFWNTSWIMIIFLCIFLIVTAAAFKRKRFFSVSLLTLNPLLFYFGMNTARASIFFPIFFFFSLYHTLEKAELFPAMKRFTLVSMILFLFFSASVLMGLSATPSFNVFGMNLRERVPVEEVELIKKFGLPPPLFNDYLSGGYMIWAMYPEYKVFIDSRGAPYDSTDVGKDYTEIMLNPTRESIRRFTVKYPFRVALISFEYMNFILSFMQNAGEDWRLLYFDKNAVILVHKTIFSSLDQTLLRAIDLDPLRYSNIENPDILFNLFSIYVRIGPRYGEIIENIYKKNVTDFYLYKNDQLRAMEMKMKYFKENERRAYQ